jgi:hypothetical protein
MSQPAKSPTAPESKAPAGAESEVLAMPVPFRPLAVARRSIIVASATNYGNLHGVITPAGTPWDHVLRADFWSLHANNMLVGDSVEVQTDDGRYVGRLLVRSVDGVGLNKTRVTVGQREFTTFDQLEPDYTATTHKVTFEGPHLRWCVRRLSENKIISDGHDSADIAASALKNLTRTPIKQREPA